MRSAAVVSALALFLTGCHLGLLGLAAGGALSDGPYAEGALAQTVGPNAVRSFGCLDVGFEVVSDDRRPLLEVLLGNRCTHAEVLDLTHLTLTAIDERGEGRAVALRDPRHEIVPLRVGGLERGVERIRIDSLSGARRVCFAFAGIADGVSEAPPLCLDRTTTGWSVA